MSSFKDELKRKMAAVPVITEADREAQRKKIQAQLGFSVGGIGICSSNIQYSRPKPKTSQSVEDSMQMLAIVDYLKSLGGLPRSLEEIEDSLDLPIKENEELKTMLQNNRTIQLKEGSLFYQDPDLHIKSEKELMQILKERHDKCLGGLSSKKIIEANSEMRDIIRRVVEKKLVYSIDDSDTRKNKVQILFFVNQSIPVFGITEDYKKAWYSVKEDKEAVNQKLRREKLSNQDASILNLQKRHGVGKDGKGRKRKQKKISSIITTNIHLKWMFNEDESTDV